jgi:hypothetical protein
MGKPSKIEKTATDATPRKLDSCLSVIMVFIVPIQITVVSIKQLVTLI